MAPAIPVAQAVGRLGNWFNQEPFGRPTDLPWALQIDPAHRPAGFADVATYHPTFLYEASWNVALAGVPVNIWVSSIVLLAALALLVIRRRRGPLGGAARRSGPADVPAHPIGSPEASSCQQVARVLQSFLDQEVDQDAVEQIEEHLEQCRRCGMEVAVYREIKDSLARAAPAIPELTLRRLQHFGEELAAGVGGPPQGSGL